MIRPVGPAMPVGGGSRQVREAGGFRLPKAEGFGAAALAATSEVGMGGMLALQELPGDEVADREARRRGQDLLEALTAMQRGLLGMEESDPRRLARLAEAVPAADDPGLREAVAAIALRARIEVARAEMARQGDVAEKSTEMS